MGKVNARHKAIARLIYDQLNEDSYLWTYDTMDEMGVPEKLQEEVAEKLFSLASDYDIGLLGVAFEHSDNDGALGYWGLFIGSFLASTLIPMSADVLLVGILALGGNVWACLVIATTGNWLGGLTSYWIGWLGRWELIERWLKVKEEKLLRQKKNIDRYGVWLALFTWLPLIGDLLAVALGFYKIKPYASAIYMLIGRFARFLLWTWLYLQYGERFF